MYIYALRHKRKMVEKTFAMYTTAICSKNIFSNVQQHRENSGLALCFSEEKVRK